MTGLPERLETVEMTTTPEMAWAYGELTADHNPIHNDPEFAAKTLFGRPIAHGTMCLNLILEAAERSLPGQAIEGLKIRFARPMPVGETVRAVGVLNADGAYDVAVELADGARAIEGVLTLAEGEA
ncbi:MAG: MaoC family dehydratase [Pseudomonadota bacterium]